MSQLWYATVNLLARAKTVTPSPAADSIFPASGLYDGRPGQIFRFGSLTADQTVVADLQALANGDMESGFTTNVPNSWTKVGAGSTADETTLKHAGAHAVSIDATAGQTYLKQVLQCYPSEYRSFKAWLRMAVAATRAGDLFVFNPRTGRYHNGTSWVGSQAAFATLAATTTYTQIGGSFQVEDFLTCGSPDGTIGIEHWIEAPAAGSGLVYVDDVEAYPGLNFSSVHGHNIDPLIALTLDSSDDNSSWATLATPAQPLPRPSFYSILNSGTPLYKRYWRQRFGGTNSSATGAVWEGEWFLAQAFAGLRNPNYPIKTGMAELQARTMTPGGSTWVYQIGGAAVRTLDLRMSLRGQSGAAFKQFRDRIYRATRGGRDIMVLAPKDDDAEVCILGRIDAAVSFDETFLGIYELGGLRITEEPLPQEQLLS